MSRPLPIRRLARVLVPWFAAGAALLFLVVGCQSKLIYFPRPYAPGVTARWVAETKGKAIDFTTSQGRQRAFLQGNLKDPRNLWIVCGGNATVALDWSGWIASHAPREDAWLLVDFPGYGDCEGAPNPARIRETMKTVIPLASRAIGWPAEPDPARLRFFGHSLGGAACLIAASEFGIQRGVLLSPFTSTMDMAREMIGLPIGFLVIHRFDNRARLAELAARGPGLVIVLHGSDDEVIPVSMGRELAADRPDVVRFTAVPGTRHNDIAERNPDQVAAALRDAGQRPTLEP